MAISDKILYLNDTKKLLKQEINKSTEITDEDTFRSYAPKIYDGYLDLLNNGTDTLWNNLEKVSASEEETPVLENVETAPIKMVLNGNTSQEIIPKDVGKEVIDTNIAITDVDIEKESYIELQGNTSQKIIPKDAGKEVTDTNIVITDVDIEKESYIELNGNTSQDTTSGKNLIKIVGISNEEEKTKTINGVTFTVNEDGTVKVEGTNNSTSRILQAVTYESAVTGEAGTYYYFANSPSQPKRLEMACFVDEKYEYPNSYGTTPWSKTATTNFTIRNIYFVIDAGETVNNVYYVILTKDVDPQPYEPYTGGIPSPNPDYPQEVKVVTGENVVSVSGKNLLEYTLASLKSINTQGTWNDNVYSWNNITFTINADLSILVNGTATAVTYLYLTSNVGLTSGNEYILNGCSSGGTLSSYSLRIYNGNSYHADIGNGYTFTYSNEDYVRINISNHATANNLVFCPMIRLSNITDDTYVPYSKTDYPINLVSKNLLDINKSTTGYRVNRNTGELLANSNFNASDYIEVESGETYYLQNGNPLFGACYDKNKEYISAYNSNSGNLATMPENAKYVRLTFQPVNADTVMFFKGSTATDYEPYFTPIELCKISTYKDYFHKDSGKWYVHKEFDKIILNENSYWYERNVTISGVSRKIFFSRSDKFKSYVSMQNMLCNYFKVKNTYGTSPTANNQFYNNYERTNNLEFAKFEFTTLTEWKEWVASHNIILVGKLATPTEEEITDTTLIAQLDALHTAELQETSYINSTPAKEYPYINLKYNVTAPAPSPDRASEINKVTGNNVVSVSGKNLFDKDVERKNAFSTGSVGQVVGYGNSSASYSYVNCAKLEANKTYTLSWVTEGTKGATTNRNSKIVDNNNIVLEEFATWINNVSKITFTPSNDGYLVLTTDISSTNIQLELGSIATDFAPYSKTDYPINLGTLELCKIGDYKDYLFKRNGKWYVHKEIEKVILDGSESWNKSSSTANTIFYLSDAISYINGSTSSSINLHCNYFEGKIVWARNVIGCELYPENSIRFGLTTSSTITTIEQWKTWLSTHNTIVYYVLETPTEEEITNTTLIEQLEALYTAELVNSTTYISTIADNLEPFIDLNYNVVIPSPSPEKPSEVKVVKGENVVSVRGKNLANFPKDIEVKDYPHTLLLDLGEDKTIDAITVSLIVDDLIFSNPKTNGAILDFRKADNTTHQYVIPGQIRNSDHVGLSGRGKVNTGTYSIVKENITFRYLWYMNHNGATQGTMSIQAEYGSTATPYVPYSKTDYPINLGDIELCKIGDYKDYFHKDSGKWYKHKEINKIILDGTNVKFTYQDQSSLPNRLMIPTSSRPRGLGSSNLVKTTHFKVVEHTVPNTTGLGWYFSTQMWIYKEGFTSLAVGNNWLSNNNVTLYYVLIAPTEEEITNSTLIEQLEAIYNAKSVKDKTYITQTNEELPFILDIEAIKEYEEN